MIIKMLHRKDEVRARRPRVTRIHLAPEGLEQRTVMSSMTPTVPVPAVPIAPIGQNALTINKLEFQNVQLQDGQLVGNLVFSGKVGNTPFHDTVAVPLTLTVSQLPAAAPAVAGEATPAAAAPVQVLNLSLAADQPRRAWAQSPPGRQCAYNGTAPITASIIAIPTGSTYTSGGVTYTGGLLGSLVGDVANLLNGGAS